MVYNIVCSTVKGWIRTSTFPEPFSVDKDRTSRAKRSKHDSIFLKKFRYKREGSFLSGRFPRCLLPLKHWETFHVKNAFDLHENEHKGWNSTYSREASLWHRGKKQFENGVFTCHGYKTRILSSPSSATLWSHAFLKTWNPSKSHETKIQCNQDKIGTAIF